MQKLEASSSESSQSNKHHLSLSTLHNTRISPAQSLPNIIHGQPGKDDKKASRDRSFASLAFTTQQHAFSAYRATVVWDSGSALQSAVNCKLLRALQWHFVLSPKGGYLKHAVPGR